MNLQKLKKEIARIPGEEKAVGIGAILAMISCFFPWYGITPVFGKYFSYNGFQGVSYIIGYFVFIFAAISFLFVTASTMRISFPRIKYAKEKLYMFFGGEALFLLVIMFFIYTANALNYSEAGVRIGLYLTFFGQIMITGGGYLLSKKTSRRSTEEIFQNPYKEKKQTADQMYEEDIPEAESEKIEVPLEDTQTAHMLKEEKAERKRMEEYEKHKEMPPIENINPEEDRQLNLDDFEEQEKDVV